MTDAEQLVGTTGEPFEMVLEAGKIREFARATKSSNPAYTGDAAIAPATFLMSSAFWTRPENSQFQNKHLNLARLLHGEQDFEFHGPPPRAGTRLRGVNRIDKVYEKEGKRGGTLTFIESVTEYRDAGTDELVAVVRNVSIETSKPTTA